MRLKRGDPSDHGCVYQPRVIPAPNSLKTLNLCAALPLCAGNIKYLVNYQFIMNTPFELRYLIGTSA